MTPDTRRIGRKDDQEKLRYDLIPMGMLRQLAAVMTVGAQKYEPNNWQRVEHARDRYYAAAMRHIEARRQGEILDPDDNLPHMSHAIACLAFIQWFDEQPNTRAWPRPAVVPSPSA